MLAQQLRERFGPHVDAPLLPDLAQRDALVAYAYLEKSWRLPVPLCRTYGWFSFGGMTCDSFGLWERIPPSPQFDARAEQVLVHHYRLIRDDEYPDEPDNDDPTEEWVVELLPEDRSDRVLVSRCSPKVTLASTVAWVWGHAQRDPAALERPLLTRADRFEAPVLDFDLAASMPALQGARLEQGAAGTDLLGDVRHRVRCRLDEGGVGVKAEARLAGLYLPQRNLVCDGPFLVLVQRRDADVPTLAAWVETRALIARGTSPA
ncbi:MAG: hypothetical protein WKG00_21845 [Polyangiaceae bacterium]